MLKNGNLLIAEPFLGDKNFERSVVLVCEHDAKGSFGFVLNQTTDVLLADVLEQNIYPDIPLFIGGPVEQNTLHFIHRRADLIEKSVQIKEGLYWSGNFEQVIELLNVGALLAQDIRFFVGYSGWGAGQLDMELKKDSWIISQTPPDFIFETESKGFWRAVLKLMGGKFKVLANYPIDPRLN